jgi:hypothetical protein
MTHMDRLGIGAALFLVAAAAVAEPLYDADPTHLWNRLFESFYSRADIEYPGGWVAQSKPELIPKRMGPDILDPPLGIHPRFLLDEKPFRECDAVLDEFLHGHAERLIRDPLKRALLQRDLWAVFDLLQTEKEDYLRNYGDTPKEFTPEQQEHRAILSRKVATVIRRLALTRKEIESLPNTYRAAVRSGAFPAKVVDQAKANYLPDLQVTKSPWVEVFPARDSTHTQIVRGRSVFRVFLKPPEGKTGAEAFAGWLGPVQKGIEARKKQREGFYQNGDGSKQWVDAITQIPVGTQLLLLREMICLDEKQNLVPTRLVESVQLRVYLTSSLEAGRNKTQLFEEFDLHRAQLFRGKQGGLKATPADEPRVFGYMALGRLAVNEEGQILPLSPFPQNCFTCHVQHNGVPVVQSLGRPARVAKPDASVTREQTIQWKQQQEDFQSLLKLIREDAPQ